jgi:predicted GNAT family acetyltransferase
MNDVRVELHEGERRYVLLVDGEHAGELVFRDRGGGVMAFIHTEVDPTKQRRGLGSMLARRALEDAGRRGLKIVPICPFVDAYIHDHPEFANLAVSDPARRTEPERPGP